MRDEHRWIEDTNPPESKDVVKAKHDPMELPDGMDDLRSKPDETGQSYDEQLVERNDLQEEYSQRRKHSARIAEEAGLSINELRKVGREKLSEHLDDSVDSGRITEVQARKVENALAQESESLKALSKASELLGERASDVVMNSRKETSLFGNDSRPGAGHLDRVGVRLNPPSITVYEAKGGSGRLGAAPTRDGTVPGDADGAGSALCASSC